MPLNQNIEQSHPKRQMGLTGVCNNFRREPSLIGGQLKTSINSYIQIAQTPLYITISYFFPFFSLPSCGFI